MAINNKILEEAVKKAVDAELKKLNESQGQFFHHKYRKEKEGSHRAEVIAWLNDPAVDCAEIARQLWPHKKEASRRSYFYKCRDHKDNGKGGKYDFNNRDYRRLYAILTSGNK